MSRNGKLIIILLSLVIFGSATGCAFGTREVELLYPPQENVTSTMVGEANAAPAAVVPGVKVILVPFEDLRANQKKVGQVRNGYGMKTADVNVTNDVSQWLTAALKLELENAGYDVTVSDEADDTVAPLISGEILVVFCDSYMTYEGEVSFLVTVTKDGQELMRSNYHGEGQSINIAATSTGFGNAISMAMEEAAHKFVLKLNSLKLK